MNWRVVVADAVFEELSESDQRAVTAEFFAWTSTGPPRHGRRLLAGAQLFEHQVPSGYRITYFVEESVPYVAVLRVRKG